MSRKAHLADQESRIRDSLFGFVKTHVPDADLSPIDEIVLSYVIAILEDISSDPVFDVEEFSEMMAAYFPAFESINHSSTCQWIFELVAELRRVPDDASEGRPKAEIEICLLPEVKQAPPSKPIAIPSSGGEAETVGGGGCFELPSKRHYKLSEMSDCGSTDSSLCDFLDEIDVLQEMFPHVCSIEVKHCLAIASGDIERATQILIDRQESGQCLSRSQTNPLTIHSIPKPVIDDAELKNRIIERYSYVDKDAFTREHRPVAPKVEPKKLVRYRDNKIVSLKGERYTEVKKGEDVDDISVRRGKKGGQNHGNVNGNTP